MSAIPAAAGPDSSVSVEVRPDSFGAAVTGVDLAHALKPGEADAIRTAIDRFGVVWFPDQPLGHDALEAFSLQLGPFGWDPYVAPLEGRPHILEVRRDPDETVVLFGGGWHSDWSFQVAPPSYTLLHAKVVPTTGGDTLFANGAAAFEALSPALQAMLLPLRGVHSAAGPYGPEGFFAKESGRTGMKILVSPEADKTHAHPLVRTHATTQRRSLFISPGYTVGIEGMTREESDALLGFLFKHMTDERFIHRHVWSADMLTIWDNRTVIHCATGGYDGQLRVMHRTVVAGERPQ